MSAEALTDFLDEQRDAAPTELQGAMLEIEDLWERKLWHQLTDALMRLFDDEQSEGLRLPFFKVFVLKFADKINQLKFVDLALKAAETCEGECRGRGEGGGGSVFCRLLSEMVLTGFRQRTEAGFPGERGQQGGPRGLAGRVCVCDDRGGAGEADAAGL